MEQKRLSIAAEVARSRVDIVFPAYFQPMGKKKSFKYLSRLLAATDNHWPVFVAKIKKERKNRAHISRFMGQ